jgi:hypothetical protein
MRSKLTDAVTAWPWMTASAAAIVNAASIRLSVKMTAEASRVTQPASRVMAPARYATPSANST